MLKEQHPTKNLQDFIKSIIDTKSKEEEDRIIVQTLEQLKNEITNINVSDAKQIENSIKAIYSDMLGQNVSFAHIFVIKLIESKNIEVKKIGYLASTLILEHDSDFKILLAASITSDLAKKDELIVITALNSVCKLMFKDSAPAFLEQMIKLLDHKNPKIVQKALMGLQRIEQLCPNSIPLYAEKIKKGLQHISPQVVAAAINIILVEIEKNKEVFLPLLPQLVQIQNQIIQKNMSYYYYQKIPEPFSQIQILKIIGKLCENNKKSSELVYDVLKKSLNRADNLNTDISHAVVYQCVLTLTKIFPKKELLEEASESISKFLTSSTKSNLVYLGINSLKHLTEIDSNFIQKHQIFVVSCLESQDETIRRITLDLLYKNTNSKNLETITSKFIESLKTTTDILFKQDLTKKIFSLCIRYTQSNEWLMEKIDLLLEFSHNDFTQGMLNELIHIYYEIILDQPEFAEKLIINYMGFFQKESISSVMIKLISWIIGNAGVQSYKEKEEFLNSLKEGLKILMHMKNSDDSCKIWILDAFESILKANNNFQDDIFDFLENFKQNFNEEIRLKIFQMQAFAEVQMDPEFDVQDADLEFDFLADFIQKKKGKYFDPDEAKNFEIFTQDQKEMTLLKFRNEEQSTKQTFQLGSENDNLILEPENKNKWTKTGYVKEKKKEQEKQQKIEVQQPKFKIFDEEDIKIPKINHTKNPEQEEADMKAKKNQNIANQLFSLGDEPSDLFNKDDQIKKPKKVKKKIKNQVVENLDFFENAEISTFNPYEISIDKYQELWEKIDNQMEKSLKVKSLRSLKDLPNFIKNLGFHLVEQNDKDFISAGKCGDDVVLMYIQFEKKKSIEVILNSKKKQIMEDLIKKIRK